MDSVYDRPEGLDDGMTAFQACHLCHNGAKKCERPPRGGKCARCAKKYVYQTWAWAEDPPKFSDNKTSDHTLVLTQALPDTVRLLLQNPRAYFTLKIFGAKSFQFGICEPPTASFWGPLTYDNVQFIQVFDNMVQCNFSTPKADVIEDPKGLVAQACLTGGYLNLLFSVRPIVDELENIPPHRATFLGLTHIVLMRTSFLIQEVMSVAYTGGMSRNARLSLAALHVIVNRIKIYTSKPDYVLPFYDDVELSKLLKDRIHALEAELRQIFKDDCHLVKDWGAPLSSGRKEFKNTTRSFDPLVMSMSVVTWDELPEGYPYPITIRTPSGSTKSPPLISTLEENDILIQHFAGLEDTPHSLKGCCWDLDSESLHSSPPNDSSSAEYNGIGTAEPSHDWEITTSVSNVSQHSQREILQISSPSGSPVYEQLSTAPDMQTDWERLFSFDEMPGANFEEQDQGSPINWRSDPDSYTTVLLTEHASSLPPSPGL